MPQIVVSDTDFGSFDFEQNMVEAAGINFAGFDAPGGQEPRALIEHLAGAQGAITSYGQYTREVFESCPGLACVCKTGTGYDNIDVEAATRSGCAVCNVPAYGTEVVSDHAIALALCVLRRVVETDRAMRAGKWNFTDFRPLGQARGRTFGVVGMGNIGRACARKAQALGFKVIAWNRPGTAGCAPMQNVEFVAFDELLARADVISFHTAYTSQTHHMLNAQNISLLKPGAVVVNTSRGKVIDTNALAQALFDGKLFGAGLDVFEEEPVDFSSAICKAPNTVLTPHSAYWSEESAAQLRQRCTQQAIDVVCGIAPESCVNPEALEAAFAKVQPK
jgi:D-3-phosphoglycerate dehydrogenase